MLRPEGSGPTAAVWYQANQQEIVSTGHRCWLTVDARHIPGLGMSGYVSIFTDEERCEGGRVEVTSSWPKRDGTRLYAHPASVLPPLEVVFRCGSDAVGEWLQANDWAREDRYNLNFKDKAVTQPYWDVFEKEFPLYFKSDAFAMLGGWHFPGQDDDWEELMDEHLMVLAFRD